jgi:hypothetical protein
MEHTRLLQVAVKVLIGKLMVYPSFLIDSPRALKVEDERYDQNLISLNLQVLDLLKRWNPSSICCGIFSDNQPLLVH